MLASIDLSEVNGLCFKIFFFVALYKFTAELLFFFGLFCFRSLLRKIVLHEIDDISNGIGTPNRDLIFALAAAWLITFLVVIKGVKSLGKASYFLAIFPYVMLIALLIRAVTLDGALDGILFLLKPNWGELLNIKVWKEAVTQCFFSLNISMSPIIIFSSYNKFDHNVHRDAMIVTTLDTFTSLLAGVTIFGILGNLAYNLNITNIDEVVKSGTGLAFISYPDAIAKFNSVPQLFAVLFFVMLSVLGIGSGVALQTTVVTIICDAYKIPNEKFWIVSIGASICGFFIGLVYITPGGQWILNLVDYYAATYTLFLLASLESIGIFWIYGTRNFCDDIEFMLKRKTAFYWRLCWSIIMPILMWSILIYSMVKMKVLTYGNTEYPTYVNIIGWLLLAIGFIQFPLNAIWQCVRNYSGNICLAISNAAKPSTKWGPADSETKKNWQEHKQRLKTLRNVSKKCRDDASLERR